MFGVPNDLALSKSGYLFLSGQDWGTSMGALWLCTPSGQARLLEGPMNRTNGIALSSDDHTLYLTEAAGSPVAKAAGWQRIWKYDVGPGGSISNKRLHFDFATTKTPEATVDSDGMRMDIRGNLYVTRNGNQKVMVISSAGALAAELSLKDIVNPTNLAIGGTGGKTIYVVGRCGANRWGEGHGCMEQLQALSPGREWSWFHEG